jgi:hypothetical protein
MCKIDRHRIEDALLPALMISIMKLRDGDCKEEESPFYNVYPILKAVVFENACDAKLIRRLDRLVNLCNSYLAREKITTQKAFIIVTRLGMLLYYHNAVDVKKGSDLYRIWREFYYTVRDDGVQYIDGIQKLYDSALGHVPRLLKLLQDEGYYL